jgi:uncharacterized protein (TIGR02246 family)
MRLLLTALCCLALAPLVLAQTPAITSADEQAIKDLVARYHTARDLDDPAAIGALFTADADQLVSTGEWRRGREALVQGMMKSTQARPGKRTITVETVRMLGPSVAIADARYVIEEEGGEPRRMWSTFVVERTVQGWKIAALRNMLPAK